MNELDENLLEDPPTKKSSKYFAAWTKPEIVDRLDLAWASTGARSRAHCLKALVNDFINQASNSEDRCITRMAEEMANVWLTRTFQSLPGFLDEVRLKYTKMKLPTKYIEQVCEKIKVIINEKNEHARRANFGTPENK